jgi:hypothetical protein
MEVMAKISARLWRIKPFSGILVPQLWCWNSDKKAIMALKIEILLEFTLQ